MNIDFWGDREARMIYIQFPIDDTSLISKSAEIFTRDSKSWPGSVSRRMRQAGKEKEKISGNKV